MIYHIALPEDWAAAQAVGVYTVSTRDVTLEEEGFVHCSQNLAQVDAVRAFVYSDLDDLVLLVIDEAKLAAPVKLESPPDSDELFPHIYGPVPVGAVVEVRPLTAG